MRAFIAAIAVIGALALAGVAGATPPPGVVIGGEGGPICQTAGFSNTGSNSHGTVTVFYHWCAQSGRIWDNYGWAVHSDPCCAPLISFAGYNPAYGFGNGYTATGVYELKAYVPIAGWVTVSRENVRSCIQVNGWGGFSSC